MLNFEGSTDKNVGGRTDLWGDFGIFKPGLYINMPWWEKVS